MKKSETDKVEVLDPNATLEIEAVKGWDKNAREIHPKDFERLKVQIVELGDYKPIIVEKTAEGYIALGGNMRLKAYRELGYKKVWAIIVKPKDDAQRLKLSLSDNDRAGYYVADLLAENLKSVNFKNLTDYKVDIKVPEIDMAGILDKAKEAVQGEDDAPALPDKSTIELGQMFRLGDHVLMCGDATKEDDVRALTNSQKVHMVFMDPPYNVDYHGAPDEGREGIQNDDMVDEAFFNFLNNSIDNALKICMGAAYICMGYSHIHTLHAAFKKAGGYFSTYIIWVKSSFTLGRSDYQHGYEIILYGWPTEVKNHYFIQDRSKSDTWKDLKEFQAKIVNDKTTTLDFGPFSLELDGKVTGRFLVNKEKVDIWRYNKPAKSFLHPTMKPVGLVEEAIINSSERGQSVFDLFGGSGTTMIACEKTGRRAFLMEIDPRYCSVIIKRWEEFTGKKADQIE